ILGLLSALYAVPFLPKAKNLRSLAGLKIYIVAMVWAGFTVLFPAMDAHRPLDWDFWILFLQRFVLVVVLIIPFEVRALRWDDKGLRTLPTVLRLSRARRWSIGLCLLFFRLSFPKGDIAPDEIVLRFHLCVVLVLVLMKNVKYGEKYL